MYKCEGSDCVDKEANCEAWADSGECEKNPDYMTLNCAKSCGKCHGDKKTTEDPKVTTKPPVNCFDKDDKCQTWADAGECEKNPDWMTPNCPKSCGKCDGVEKTTEDPKVTTKPPVNCVDKDDKCQTWADAGECEKNPFWMTPNCPKSCGKCDGDKKTTEDPKVTTKP